MNIHKPKPKLIYSCYICLIVVSVLALYFVPNAIYYCGEINWLFSMLVAVIIITPLGKKQINSDPSYTPKQPLSLTLRQIIITQLAVIGMFYFSGQSFIRLNATTVPSTPDMTSHFFSTMIHFGLFPWTMIAITSLVMAITSYNNNSDAYPSSFLTSSTQTVEHRRKSINLFIDAQTRNSFVLALATVISGTILLSLTPTFTNNMFHQGFNYSAVIIAFTVIILFNPKRIARISFQVLKQNHIVSKLVLYFSFIITIILLLLSHLFSSLAAIPDQDTHILTLFPWQSLWKTVEVIWWISITPAISCVLCRSLVGYSYRQSLSMICLLPAVISISHYIIQTGLKINLSSIQLPVIIQFILCWLCMIIFCVIIFSKNNRSNIQSCMTPKPSKIKPRNPIIFSTQLLKMITLMTGPSIIFGVIVPSIYLIFSFWVTWLLLTLSIPFSVKKITKNSVKN